MTSEISAWERVTVFKDIDFEKAMEFLETSYQRDCSRAVGLKLKEKIEMYPWRYSTKARLDHVIRVRKNAQILMDILKGKGVTVKEDRVIMAAILHDITKAADGDLHNVTGAKIACKYLMESGFSQKEAQEVGEIIYSHSLKGEMKLSFNIEQRVLQDADLMEKGGLNGILRSVMYTGSQRLNMHDALLRVKQLDLIESEELIEKANLDITKSIMEEKRRRVLEFVANLEEELNI